MLTEVKNHYFKDAGQRPFVPMMSGLPLPLDADGVCRNVRFIRCEFHPCCDAVKFVGCEFYGCEEPGKW